MACVNSIGFTQIAVNKSQFIWRIHKFSSLSYVQEPSAKIESPIFTAKSHEGIKWQLILWPNGRDQLCNQFMSASLKKTEYDNSNVDVQFEISILDIKCGKRFEHSKKFTSWTASFDGFNEFVKKDILQSEARNIIINDVLTICCELIIVDKGSMANIDESIQQQSINIDKKVLSAFGKQLEKEEFSDVKLIASCGKELRAHKFVLAAHSPVFSAMFTNDMKEKDDHTVVIKDLDYNSLQGMLHFMYAGRVENLDKSLAGILAAQEKYQIDGLKEYCEEYLFHNINIDNAVEALAFSIRYNIEKIKFLSTKLIQFYGKDVCETDAFKAIEEPKFLAEIVRILANNL